MPVIDLELLPAGHGVVETSSRYFVVGIFELRDPGCEAVFTYVNSNSKGASEIAVVLLNISKEVQAGPHVVDVIGGDAPRLLVSTTPESAGKLKDGRPMLAAWEGRYVDAV